MVAIAGVVGLAALTGRSRTARSVADIPRPGSPAAEFTAFTIDSPQVRRTLADYSGQPVIVNVWATWCPPCVEEMPSFQRLHRDYGERGLRVVAISVDGRSSTQLIREFVEEFGLTFDVLHDASANIMSDYAVRGVPETFLISRSGELVARRFVTDWDTPASRALVDSLRAIAERDR
jgi:peroxiredoxin